MPSGHRPQPPVGTARVAISGTGTAGNPWVNVLWLSLTATTHVQADLANVTDAMVAAFNTDIWSLMANDHNLTAAKATWLYASGQSIEYTGSYSHLGGLTGGSATDAACAVVDWAINDYYRGGHPRSYIAGVRATDIANARTLGATERTNLAAGANSFITAVNALTHGGISAVALGTVRFQSGNAWLTPPVFRAYQSASVRSILGTQRRRFAA